MLSGQLGPVRRLLASGTAREGYVAVADQGLVSGTNFLITYALASVAPPAEFGAFALATGALLFLASLQHAVVTGPLAVIGPKLEARERRSYMASSAVLQGVLAGLVAAVLLAVGLVMNAVDSGTAGSVILALAPAASFWQLQEFARRALYSLGRARSALMIDAVTYGGQLVLLAGLAATGRLDAVGVLLAIAASSAAGAAIGTRQLRRAAFPLSGPGAALRRNWGLGRWLLGARLTEWASDNLFPFLAGAVLGLAAPGVLRALQLVVAPSYVLSLALDAVLTPKAARVYERAGYRALGTFIRRVYLVSLPVALGYLVVVAALSGPLLRVLYGEKYGGYGGLLALSALAYGLAFVKGPVSIALRAKEVTRPVFLGYALSTLATFTLGLWLITQYGLWGAVAGGVVNAVIQNVVLWDAWFGSPRDPGSERGPGADGGRARS